MVVKNKKRGGLINDLSNRDFFNNSLDLDYIIHSHGSGHDSESFIVPANTFIYVYSPLGSILCLKTSNNDICARRGTYHRVYGPGEEFPELYLTGDPQRQWQSGIKRCDDNAIIFNINHNTDTNPFILSLALPRIQKNRIDYLIGKKSSPARVVKSDQSSIHIHIMACTINIPKHLVDRSANKSIMTEAYTSTGRRVKSVLRPPNGLDDVYNMVNTHRDKYYEIKPKIDRLLSQNNYDWQFNELRTITIENLTNTTSEHMERLVGLSVLMHKQDRTYYRMAERLYEEIFRDKY